MPFLDQDVVVRQSGVDHFELTEQLRYEVAGQIFTIPAGFSTDFASVPRPFVWLLPKYGVYTRAAILHDYLVVERPVSPVEADRMFRDALKELGTPLIRRWMMWAGVRLGGRLGGSSPLEVAAWILVAVPSLVFLAIPALAVLIWLVLFFILELVTWPFTREKQPPEFTITTQ